METSNSFSDLLDRIFSHFDAIVPVMVFYKASESVNPGRLRYRIEAVNGSLTLKHFIYEMNDMMMKLIYDIMDADEQLPPESRLLFLREAIIRSKKLSLAVTRLRVPVKAGKIAAAPGEIRWIFRKPACLGPGPLVVTKEGIRVMCLRLTRHAMLWHLIVEQILKELECFYAIRKIFPTYGYTIFRPEIIGLDLSISNTQHATPNQ